MAESTGEANRGQSQQSAIKDLSARPDGSWITLSGKVQDVNSQAFTLDYGDRDVEVELDDWDAYPETHALKSGDQVTVFGRIDKDFMEARSIEANSVFVQRTGIHHFASSMDEENTIYYLPAMAEDGDWVSVTGTVRELEGDDFMLDTVVQSIEVNAGGIDDNPLDDEGDRRIREGDRVTVYGEFDDADLFDSREIEAAMIIKLDDGSRNQSSR